MVRDSESLRVFLEIVRQSPVTFSLIVSLIVPYIAFQLIFGFNLFITPDPAIILFGQVNYLIFLDPLPNSYRFITPIFVHSNIIHLGSNLLFLLIYGLKSETKTETEQTYGSIRTLVIFFGSGIAGNILSLILGPNVISVGASGAVFGLLGGNLVALRREYQRGLLSAAGFGLIFFLMTISSGNINVVAHLGGLIAGGILGLVLLFPLREELSELRKRYSLERK